MNTLVFDFDGTVYPLYKLPDWLNAVETGDMTIFNHETQRKSLPEIRAIVRQLQACGWRVIAISWAPIGVAVTDDTFTACADNKAAWMERYFPELETLYVSEYGKPKALTLAEADMVVGNGTYCLVDDNAAVRKEWRSNGKGYITIDATKSILKKLRGLIG